MKYFATFSDGFPAGFWNDDIFPDVDGAPNTAIPADAVQITVQQWRAFIDHPGLRKWVDGHAVPYTPPGPSADDLINALRIDRDQRLRLSDWVTLRAIDAGEPVPSEWRDYRQALRDLPDTTADPSKVVWPKQPS